MRGLNRSPTPGPGVGRSPVRSYCIRVTLGVAAGLPAAALLFGPAMITGFREGSPPNVRANLDAFLTPMSVTLVAATLGGSIVASGDKLRHASSAERSAATWFAVLLSVVLAAAVYALVGWGLPHFLQRHGSVRVLSVEQAMQAHPFLLTTPDLLRAQEAFRAVGGFSRRIARTLELRAWLAASIPVFALLSVVAMLQPRPRARVLKVLAVQVGALAYCVVAVILTVGPALFLRPHPAPSMIAWAALIVLACACVWLLRRMLYPAREALTRVLD